jgi:retron-type reverse transcriptase
MSFTNTPLGSRRHRGNVPISPFYQVHLREMERRRARWRQAKQRRTKRPQTFENIMYTDELLRVFNSLKKRAGQAHGVDGITYAMLGHREIAKILRETWHKIDAGTYMPQPTRPCRIPKPSGGSRTLQIATIVDRVVATRVHEILSPVLEAYYVDQSHGFRKRRNIFTLLAELEYQVTAANRCVLVNEDIVQAFDNIPIQPLLDGMTQLIEDPRMMALVATILRGNNPERSLGIDQGCALSPAALNVYLTTVHDRPMTNLLQFPSWLRYADNIVYLTQEVSEGNRVYDQAETLLLDAGLAFKHRDSGITSLIDLRCEATTLLGFRLSMQDNHIRYDVTEDVYDNLENGLWEAYNTQDPPLRATAIIYGLLNSMGPALDGERMASNLNRIRNIAVHAGFTEIPSIRAMQSQGENAYLRWQKLRRRHVH